MKTFLFLLLFPFGCFAANVTNLPAIADKPWTTNLLRSSAALGTNTPTAGQVLTTSGTSNYWATVSGGSSGVDSFVNIYGGGGSGLLGQVGTLLTNTWTNIIQFEYAGSAGPVTNIGVDYITGIVTITNAGTYYLSANSSIRASNYFGYLAVKNNGAIYNHISRIQVTNSPLITLHASMTMIFYASANNTIQMGWNGSYGSATAYDASLTIFRLK